MIKYNPKHQVKVAGKMNTQDAGTVGKMLACAAIIASLGIFLFGLSFTLKLFI